MKDEFGNEVVEISPILKEEAELERGMAIAHNAEWWHDNYGDLPEWGSVIKMETDDAVKYLEKVGYPKPINNESVAESKKLRLQIGELNKQESARITEHVITRKWYVESIARAISDYLTQTKGVDIEVTPQMYWDAVMTKAPHSYSEFVLLKNEQGV